MQGNTTDLVAASADTSSSSRWNWKSKLQSVSQLNRNRRADTVVLFRYFPNDRSSGGRRTGGGEVVDETLPMACGADGRLHAGHGLWWELVLGIVHVVENDDRDGEQGGGQAGGRQR